MSYFSVCKEKYPYIHIRIIIATALHCYDSVASSMVNQEVQIFNRKLETYTKQNTHANILLMEHDRKYFTNHDLHLNNMNKEYIWKQLEGIMEKPFIVNDRTTIPMSWITEQVNANIILSKVHSDNIDNSRNNTVTRTSNKKRKASHNRNEDFIWEV